MLCIAFLCTKPGLSRVLALLALEHRPRGSSTIEHYWMGISYLAVVSLRNDSHPVIIAQTLRTSFGRRVGSQENTLTKIG